MTALAAVSTPRLARRGAALAVGVLVAACVSSGSGASEGPRDILTREEIVARGASGLTALEVIQRLRPEFLQRRGLGTGSAVAVYVDGLRQENAAALRDVPAASIAEIRYLSARDATTRFGTGHVEGAILITTEH